jgi:MoaA/NifB/PqqE/SkfB family radical SAM enzyme
MTYPKPWSIQLEITEGCNRRCSFCGIHSLYREKSDLGYKFMTVEMARAIAKDLAGWLPKIRLEFALQGEPLLNPNHLEIFRTFREEFPKCQIMVTSNMDSMRKGKGFDEEKLKKLFLCGVNILVADYYGEKNDMPYQEFKDGLKNNGLGLPVYDFYEDKPKVWAYVGPGIGYIVALDNTFDRSTIRSINNQAGNMSPAVIQELGYPMGELPKKTRCHLPFREMSIKQDGSVMMCCMDWLRESVQGKFPEQSYKEIWEGESFNLVRHILQEKRRDLINPCDRCNYNGVKVGLITKVEMIQTPEQSAIIYKQKQKDFKNLHGPHADEPFVYK